LCAGTYDVTVTDINGCSGTATVTVNEPSAITATTSSVQATCGLCDGSATVNPSGGTGTLNVQWDAAAANQTTATATALCAGAYIATITDGNGCSVTQTVPVSNVTGEVLTLTSTDASCNGVCDGTVNVTFNCVDAPCSLVWNDPSASTSNTVNGLCAGTYAATVTNNSGCITVATVDVNEPLPLQANLSSTDVLCFGDCNGTGISVPSGGTAPYTYQWNAAAGNQTTSTAFNLCPGTYSLTVTDANGCTDGGSVTVGEPSLLTANAVSANASCNNVCDGTGTIFPAGGTAPYSYTWDDPSTQTTQSATGLCAGSYNVTLIDNNGCTVGPLSISVAEPTAIDVSTTFTTIDCNGDCDGTISSTVTGGTAPYTYAWNDPLTQTTATATNLCAGTFTLNVTDVNGCPGGPVSVNLSEPAAITSTFAFTQPNCNGDCNGSIVSNVSGGTLPYTFVWNDPALTSTPFVSNLCAGNYDLTVTDANGCVTSIAAVLTEPAALDANLTSTNINCFGNCNGTATATPSGGIAPYTYLWTTGATSSNIFSLCPNVYGVTVTDANGCIVSDSRNIIEPSELVLTTASSNSSCGSCNGSISVSPSGGNPGYNYLWSPSTGSQTTQAATGLCSGLHFVTVTDATGCSASATVGLSDNGAETIAMTSTDAACFGSCNGTATANTACVNVPCSFVWYNGATGAVLPGQTNATASGLCDGFYQVEVINGLGCSSFDTVTIEEPDQMVSNATATNVDCFGNCNGTLSANATGGTGAISYQWDAAAGNATTANVTGLCAGTFVVTMTDALGCTEDETLTITQPTQLLATVSATDVLCNGDCTGTGTANISGGTFPYTISWNDPSSQNTSTAINLCAGNFAVNITDANGCPASGNITVNEPTLLSANVTTTPNLCNGDCTGTATATPAGGTSPYNFVWNDPALQTTATANGLCTGTYQVVVVDASGCATNPINATITDPASVTFTAVVNDVSCNASCNGSIVITASGGDGNYLYSIDGGASFQASNTFNGLCSGAYSVVVQDGNLCASIPQNVNVNEPTAITANTSFFPADCNVSNGAATAVPSGGTPGYTYVWYNASLVALGQTNQTAINLGAGVYVVDITDANGCVEQVSVTVSNTNAPSTTAVVSDATCFGQCNGAIDVTTSGGLAPYTWSWVPGGESTEDLSNLCAGGYIVETTDANGCISFGNYTVNEPTTISGTFVTVDAACGQCNGTATFNASGGTGALAYAWSNGQAVQAATGLCAGAYMVQVTDANGCAQTFNTSINNIGGPTSETVIKNDVSCFGVCDGDANITPIGGTAPYTYYWVHNGATTNTLSGMCAGTYFMEVTDSLGCVRVSNVTINEPAEMTDSTVLFASTCGLCDGGLSVFVSGGTTPYSYQWDAAAGAATTSIVNALCEGIYVLVVTDANGCRDTIVNPVNGATAPQTVVTPVNVSCEGQCDGSATAAIALGTAPYTSTWLDDLGNPIGQTGTTANALCEGDYFVQVVDAVGCTSFEAFTITEPDSLMFSLPFTQDPSCFNTCDGIGVAIVISGTLPYTFSWNDPATQTTASATGLCSGTYTVTVTDGNGCSNAQQVVIDQPVPITLLMDSTDASCSTVPDGAIDATPGGGAGGFLFSWSGPSGFTATTEDITNIFTGWYFLTVTDANGCSLTDSIFVGAVLVVDANAGNDTVICGGAASGIVLTGSGGVTYEWYDMAGTLLSSTSQVTVTPAIPTSYVLVANNNGCIDRDTIDISINPTPIVDAGPDVQLILGNSTSIGGSPTTAGTNTVVWTPSTYLDDPNIFNPVSTPDSSTTYIVTATDANGCVASDTMRVYVFPDISFPNGFSPNGDGLNDTWIIDLIDMFPNCTVEIYNRWGQLLFLSNGYLVPWDGTYNNQPVPVGTYYYIINLNHPLYPDAFTGPLTVLR
jgi:gliding motility-associated-like protein